MIIIETPTPVIWGIATEGNFWFNPLNRRLVVQRDPHQVLLIEDALLCGEHGIEGEPLRNVDSLKEAFAWLGGGNVPDTITWH